MTPQDTQKNITMFLDSLARIAIELDCGDGEVSAEQMQYTEEDLMNATIVFNHVASNIRILKAFASWQLEDEQKHSEFQQESMDLWLQLRSLIIRMTGFDPHEYATKK